MRLANKLYHKVSFYCVCVLFLAHLIFANMKSLTDILSTRAKNFRESFHTYRAVSCSDVFEEELLPLLISFHQEYMLTSRHVNAESLSWSQTKIM